MSAASAPPRGLDRLLAPGPRRGLDRLLERVLRAPGGDAPEHAGAKLLAMRQLVLLGVATEAWHALGYPAFRAHAAVHVALASLLTAALGLALHARFARLAAAGAALAVAVQIVLVFPENGNHQLVALLALAFSAVPADGRAEERPLALQAGRWLFLLAFVWAGVQKLLYGYWWGGEFLAHEIARDPSFAQLFGPLLPAGELERLRGLGSEPGAGPFRVDSALLVLVSNGAWLAELALPPLLFHDRTRALGVAGCLGFLVAIELAAREIFFGALMAGLALLFLPGDANRRALPWLGALYAAVLATDVGLLPSWSFG